MIKFIVAMFLISFDAVVSPNGQARFDLLPDFIGYGIMIYGFWKFWKKDSDNGKENSSLRIAIKQAWIVSGVAFVASYVAYILDMYGILYKINDNIVLFVSLLLDLCYLVAIFMFIQVLSAMQGRNTNFQVKRMTMLWKFMFLCIVCEYISLPISSVAMTFFIFDKVINMIFMFYIFTSNITYKKKF
jgi:hypothetical protein